MKIPASKVPAQVWADKARRRADLDEVESMLLSSWDDSKQVYRIGKELWDELRIDEADEVPVDALLRLPYGCIFIERRWVDEYEQLLTDDMADTWGEASCYVTRYYEGCFCWVEGRTLFVDSLTHHCEMRHTDDYGSDVTMIARVAPCAERTAIRPTPTSCPVRASCACSWSRRPRSRSGCAVGTGRMPPASCAATSKNSPSPVSRLR